MRRKSIYFILIAILLSTVSAVMFLYTTYSYNSTKKYMTEQTKESLRLSVQALEKNVAALMSAYSVYEYEILVKNQMKRADIFSIIVEDYNMGKITGKESYVSGFIKDKSENIIEYSETDKEHARMLQECQYIHNIEVYSSTGVKLGALTVYASSAIIDKALKKVVYETLLNTIAISLLLTILLFFAIRHFIVKPISDIVDNLALLDNDGIPGYIHTPSYSKEIHTLICSINNMTSSISNSRAVLKEQNEHLQELVESETSKRLDKEKILLQQSKMAMMGEMIGAIAHQWRQPLNTLGLKIQDIDMAYKYKELTEEYIRDFKQSSMAIIQRMSKTIDDFRNFFRPNENKMDFSLEQAIEDAISIIGQQLKNHAITLTFHREGEHTVSGYQNEIVQTILILLSNAQDILLDNNISKPTIDITVTAAEDNSIEVAVQDNGGGVPEGIANRVFEPYFTTKEQGKGTGIGLYMAKEIVERQMGGKIYVENINGGARFVIELPHA